MSTRRVIPLFVLALLLSLAALGACSKSDDEHGEHGSHEDVHAEHDEEEGEHAEHGEDEEEGEHDDKKVVALTQEEQTEFGIEIRTAEAGNLRIQVRLPGEIQVNADRLAHIVPRVAGVVSDVRKGLGEKVRAGEWMAVIESRELADAKAGYLAAFEKVALAQANFDREESLFKQEISSEREYLDTKQALAEARIERRSAEQKLHSLGFSNSYLKALPKQPNQSFTRYPIVAPIAGTVVKKHITLGEKLNGETNPFTVADLSNVWVNLTVYQKDLGSVQIGQEVVILANQGNTKATGKIDYLSPFVEESTRTATGRVVLDNKDGRWRPGMFISAMVAIDAVEVPLLVPKTALQTLDGKTVVFVLTDDGFEPHAVTIGRSSDAEVEITSGLASGEKYAATNPFILKAELGKASFGGHHH